MSTAATDAEATEAVVAFVDVVGLLGPLCSTELRQNVANI